jgi:hypothetical protein
VAAAGGIVLLECRLGRGTVSAGQARGALSARAGCSLPGLTERRQLCPHARLEESAAGLMGGVVIACEGLN